MSDEEIEQIINTMDILAKDAIELARRKPRIQRDAKALAELTYDIYKEDSSK
jgi:hypothetical protein